MKLSNDSYTIYMSHGVNCGGISVCDDIDIDSDLYLALLKLEAMINSDRVDEFQELIELFESIELLDGECENENDEHIFSSIRENDASKINITSNEKKIIKEFYEDSISGIYDFEVEESLPYAEEEGDKLLIEAINNSDFWISLHSEYQE